MNAPVRPWRPAQRSSLSRRDFGELYETPAAAVHGLIKTGELDRFARSVIWEPAAGGGAIVRELIGAGFRVRASDLIAYKDADPGIVAPIDFLEERSAPAGVSVVVTNPPFRNADAFIRHGLELGLPAVVLLRLQGLEGVGRSDLIDRHLRRVWVGIERLPTMHRLGWDGPRTKNGGAPFMWAVFAPGARSGPIELERISWRNEFAVVAPHDDDRDIPGESRNLERKATKMESNLERLSSTSAYALTAEDRALLTNKNDYADVPSRGPALTTVIQPAGKELDPSSPKFVAGARPGAIAVRFNGGESVVTPSVDFIPVAVRTLFNIFERGQGNEQGAFRETVEKKPLGAAWQCDANGRKRCLLPDGAQVTEQKILIALEALTQRPIAIEAHSTALAAMRDMLEIAKNARGKHPLPDGAIERFKGLCFTKWRMTTEEHRRNAYRWFGPRFSLLGKLGETGGPTIAECLRAKRAREAFFAEGAVIDDTESSATEASIPAEIAAPLNPGKLWPDQESAIPDIVAEAGDDRPFAPIDDDIPF